MLEELKQQLSELTERVDALESNLNDSSKEIKDLSTYRFTVMTRDDTAVYEVEAYGETRRWREIHDARGYIKFSNWYCRLAVSNAVTGEQVKCDWIQVSECNYSITQARTVVDSSTMSFTTPSERGWADLKFLLTLATNGARIKLRVKIRD